MSHKKTVTYKTMVSLLSSNSILIGSTTIAFVAIVWYLLTQHFEDMILVGKRNKSHFSPPKNHITFHDLHHPTLETIKLPYRFSLDDIENAYKHFVDNGFAVVSNILSETDINTAKQLLWDHFLSQDTIQWQQNNPDTWQKFPGMQFTGIIGKYGVGQSLFQWYIRTRPNVINTFCQMYNLFDNDMNYSYNYSYSYNYTDDMNSDATLDVGNCKNNADNNDHDDSSSSRGKGNYNYNYNCECKLLTSFDGIGIFRPWKYKKNKYKWDTIDSWYHIDQNIELQPNFETIQSLVTLYDQTQDTGSIVVIPKSHLLTVNDYQNVLNVLKTGILGQITDSEFDALKFNLGSNFITFDDVFVDILVNISQTKRKRKSKKMTFEDLEFESKNYHDDDDIDNKNKLRLQMVLKKLKDLGLYTLFVTSHAGDMILWDSRLIHCNFPSLDIVNEKFADHDKVINSKHDDLLRLVSYVSMIPKYKVSNHTILSQRIKAFENGLGSNHVANGNQFRFDHINGDANQLLLYMQENGQETMESLLNVSLETVQLLVGYTSWD